MHAKVADGQLAAYPYTVGMLRQDNPNTLFPAAYDLDDAAEYGVVRVEMTSRPAVETTQRVMEGPPELVGQTWVQTWIVTDKSTAELAAELEQWRASASVTPLQIRRALLAQGLLDEVQAFVEASDLETRMAWEYAVQIDRSNALIAAAADAIGATAEDVDGLFRLAATL